MRVTLGMRLAQMMQMLTDADYAGDAVDAGEAHTAGDALRFPCICILYIYMYTICML